MSKAFVIFAAAAFTTAPALATPIALSDAEMTSIVAGRASLTGYGHETADRQTANVDHSHFGLVENATGRVGFCVGNGRNTGTAAGCLD